MSKFVTEPGDVLLPPAEPPIHTPTALIGMLRLWDAPLDEQRAAMAAWLENNEPSETLRATMVAWPEFADLIR